MKLLLVLLMLSVSKSYCQRIVYDPGHFSIVNQNGAMRLASEMSHNSYLRSVTRSLEDMNLNMTSVILVQNMIKNSLIQVDQALKSGIAVRQLSLIGQEILQECEQMMEIARANPQFLLFAEDAARQLKSRAVKLATEVAAFIQQEGEQVMMDYRKRDELLRKVILEMKVIRALCFSMHRSVYWAAASGLLKSLNPFQQYINQDIRIAGEIIRNYKQLEN